MDDAAIPGSLARLGIAGEQAALAAYTGRGFRLVAQNWRCRAGELDLVLERGGTLVFCEVKARSGRSFGGGHEAVRWSKQRKVRQLAELFLLTWRRSPDRIRFDVASVSFREGRASVHIYEDAF